MEPILVPIIVLSIVFMAIQAFVVLFLAKRAVELKLRNLWFLIASFGTFIVAAMLGAINSAFQILVQPFGPLIVIEFTRSTFYHRVRSNHALVVIIAAAFTVLTFAVKFYRLVAGDSDILYFINHVALFCVFYSAYAWLAKACFNASKHLSKGAGIDPWITKRYLLLGASAAFISLLITPAFFMGSMSSYYSILGFFCLLLIVVQLLAFSVLNYLCWVMPPRFKRWLGVSQASFHGTGGQNEAPALKDKVLTTRETMAITDYLGNILATRINKSPAALKGLLLVTFQGEQDEGGITPLNFSDVIHAINHRLKNRLEQLGIKDAEAITKEFSEDVTRNQSVLLMMSV